MQRPSDELVPVFHERVGGQLRGGAYFKLEIGHRAAVGTAAVKVNRVRPWLPLRIKGDDVAIGSG